MFCNFLANPSLYGAVHMLVVGIHHGYLLRRMAARGVDSPRYCQSAIWKSAVSTPDICLLRGYIRTQLQLEVQVQPSLATLEWHWTQDRHHQYENYKEVTEEKSSSSIK